MKRSMVSVMILAAVLAFLYVPIILVVVYGFVPNGISMSFFGSDGSFLGFTGKWYKYIFTGHQSVRSLLESFWLSLIIAGLSTLASCAIGTTSALALHKWKDRLQSVHHALVYTPLVMPDILIGISLLMLFAACHVNCGFWTILIAHITFCVSYVAMTVLARLQDFDDRITEAAYDLCLRGSRTSTTALPRRRTTSERGLGTRSSTSSCRYCSPASSRAGFSRSRFPSTTSSSLRS